MTRSVATYVALGDSFTSGTDPVREGRWADDVAGTLGASVAYANLAEVGATSRRVEEHQLPRGLAMEPDLVTLICGANDVLETVRPEPEEFRERLSRMVERIRASVPDATVVTATYPDLSRFLDLRERTRDRVRRGMRHFNDAVRAVSAAHGVLLLEWAEHPGTGHRGNFASDGFHPSPEGHRRAAAEVVAALGERLQIEIPSKEETAA
jgi:lysophospholipase L1-like esterase